jgi:hypothetical protein
VTWTKQQYIDNFPASPEGTNGQPVDDGAVLRAMDEHAKLMEQCTCEYDGGYGDDGSQVRRLPKDGCPVHELEDHDCLTHLQYREHDAVEPHGERHRDAWYQCAICQEKFTVEEVDQLAEQSVNRTSRCVDVTARVEPEAGK